MPLKTNQKYLEALLQMHNEMLREVAIAIANQYQILLIQLSSNITMTYLQVPEQQSPEKGEQTVMGLLRDFKRDWDADRDKESSNKYKQPIFTVNDMENTFLTLDKSLLYVGDNSTFQKRITLILAIQWISFSFMVNTMAYFFRSPSFTCRIPLTDIFYTCSENIACERAPGDYRVIQSGTESIAQQFQLYCGQGGNIYEVESLFLLGGFLSGYLMSYISEKIGRRYCFCNIRSVIMGVLILSIVSIVLCAWAPTFTLFRSSYFFAGCFLFGYETQIYLYISEISAVRFKTISINMLTMVWAGTPIFLTLLTFLPTWRICFYLFAFIWLCTLPFAYFCFLQSPRFLLSKKCYEQVKDIFQKISITNRRPPYQFRLAEEMEGENQTFCRLKESERQESKEVHHEERLYSFLDLFRFKSLRRSTFVLMYLWTFRFFIYFGINLALESVLKSGFWLTFAIAVSSVSEVIGTFGLPILKLLFSNSYTSIDILKRCFFWLSIFLGLLYLPSIDNQCTSFEEVSMPCFQMGAMILLVCCIKFVNSMLFAVLITYSSEAYPAVVRSLGYGFTLTFGRMSTFISPYFINYVHNLVGYKNPLCFLAPFGVIGLYLCVLMPRSDAMSDILIEEQNSQRTKEIEMVSMRLGQSLVQKEEKNGKIDGELIK